MSYIVHKTISGKQYAYRVTSVWDKKAQKVKKTNQYLGRVADDGSIIKKSTAIQIPPKNSAQLDFGDGYLLHEALRSSLLQPILPTLTVV